MADVSSAVRSEAPSVPVSEWRVNPAFDSFLPSLSHGDAFARSKASDNCAADWSRFRRQPVTVQPIRASRAALEAEAQRKGLSVYKLQRLMATFLKNQSGLPNQRFVTVIDFDKAGDQERMFVVDLQEGKIRSYKVANGENSGPRAGIPTQFSNAHNTYRSSLGCAVATFDHSARTDRKGRNIPLLDGRGRHKLMMHGFDNTDALHSNDQMCNRSIFMHPADYAVHGGRSYGCPAVDPRKKQEIYNQIGNGGLVCTYRDGDSKINNEKNQGRIRARKHKWRRSSWR